MNIGNTREQFNAEARTDWIMTASGRAFYPTAPVPEDIDIEDIAHALACVNRFQGHTREPYSVAQHSVLLSYEMARLAPADHARALYGLLHDASEAYLCDVPRPLKRLPEFAPYREAEARLQSAIYEAFGLDVRNEPADLKEFDRRMLRTEQAQLMPPAAPGETRTDVPVFPILISVWPWMWAREMFRLRFRDLFNLRSPGRAAAMSDNNPTDAERMARQIAEDLFVNGAGEKADRLVLTQNDGSHSLGGWSKPAVIGRVLRVLSPPETLGEA